MRLKQWAFERVALRHGRAARIEQTGWRERRMSEADSRNVRVLDFERAMSQLDPLLRCGADCTSKFWCSPIATESATPKPPTCSA